MSSSDPYSLETRVSVPLTPSDKVSFAEASEQVVQEWRDNLPDYTGTPGTVHSFVTMGNEYVRRIREVGASERFKTSAIDGGMDVVARFIYVGAARSALNGFSISDYNDAMRRRETFGTLSRITHERNGAAVEIERSLGIRSGFSPDERLGLYEISPEEGLRVVGYTSTTTGKVFESYPSIRSSARYQAALRHEEKAEGRYTFDEVRDHYKVDDSQCVGHTSGVVRLSFNALLGISIMDPNLYQGTVERVDDIRAIADKAQPAYARKISPPLL